MKNFLFEQYGYYPDKLVDNSFILDGWKFKLMETDLTSEQLKTIEEYIRVLNQTFNNKGPFIVKNKVNNYISSLNNINYVLVSCFLTNMSYSDLNKFHMLFYRNDEYIELDKVLSVWKNRVDEVEKKLNVNLRMESVYYKNNLEIAMFCVGLAINAMQYLSDIIYNYDNMLYGVTIVHKRLPDLNSFDFFNPFNFIVEHPLKDFCFLYQKDYISVDELLSILDYYNFDVKTATFLFARILYRADVFDFIETKRTFDASDQKIEFNLEKEMKKIKRVYVHLRNKYSIRPLDWLENRP